jgi:hypothetical protein
MIFKHRSSTLDSEQRVRLLTVSDFKKVEERLPRYLNNYPQGDTSVTEKAGARVDPKELSNYRLLLEDAFAKGKVDEGLYKKAIGLVENWEKINLQEKIAVGLLIKRTRNDTALWDLLTKS